VIDEEIMFLFYGHSCAHDRHIHFKILWITYKSINDMAKVGTITGSGGKVNNYKRILWLWVHSFWT